MVNVRDDAGCTPLFYIVEEDGSENLVNYLIGKGADVNAKDTFERTPLHTCARTGKSLGC